MPELVPQEQLGRVSSIDELGSSLLLPLGIVVIGALTDHGGPSLVFVFGGAFMLLLVVGGLCLPGIRNVS